MPYQTTHNTGGAIMGDNPANSVVNKYLQSWDVPNVFSLGAGAFPQNAGYNPTGTVAALAYLAARRHQVALPEGARRRWCRREPMRRLRRIRSRWHSPGSASAVAAAALGDAGRWPGSAESPTAPALPAAPCRCRSRRPAC